MIPGKIRIKDQKIYFEYYELDKPNKKIYEKAKVYNFENLIIQKYEASKQLIEVANVMQGCNTKQWYYYLTELDGDILDIINGEKVKNNQLCKAEVTGETKANIIELIK